MKKVTKVFAFLILLWLILAFFAPYNNVAGVAVLIAVIVSGIVFILMPYVTVRLAYWVYVVAAHFFYGKEIKKPDDLSMLLDILLFPLAAYILYYLHIDHRWYRLLELWHKL